MARPRRPASQPVHVTLRVLKHVWRLRSARCFRAIEDAFVALGDREGIRITHHSVQANHIHLIVEAGAGGALSRGMQGLCVRIARGLNRAMRRTGTVFADRYHARALASPREVRNAVRYVLDNLRKHAKEAGLRDPGPDPLSAGVGHALAERAVAPGVSRPRTWLLARAAFG